MHDKSDGKHFKFNVGANSKNVRCQTKENQFSDVSEMYHSNYVVMAEIGVKLITGYCNNLTFKLKNI